jgi:hypothetical protein
MIYTSYFGNKKAFNDPNICPISIALYPSKEFVGKSYRALAPNASTLRDWKQDHSISNYERDYAATLDKLDPGIVVVELLAMAGNLKGVNYNPQPALLCYERPGEFCHRHIVAEWLRNAGYEIEEL